jgi:hypothetical protein
MHNDVIPAWNTFLHKLFNIDIAFINIDKIELLDDTYEETKENLLNIISQKTIFFQKKAGFLKVVI